MVYNKILNIHWVPLVSNYIIT